MISPLPRMTICEGAISSGKTFICNHKAIEHIVNNYTNQGLIFFVGRTLTTLERNVLEPLALQYGRDFKYSLNQKKASICGIRIELEGCNDISAEAKIRGSTAEFIYGDELTLWNRPFLVRCMGSLRTPNACFLGTTNPDSPMNFVKSDYLDRKDELGLKNIKFDMKDNPSLTQEYIDQVSKEYLGVFHDRFIKGLWVQATGRIYDMFNEKINVVPSEQRAYTRYYVSCDYGTQNPTTFGLWGLHNAIWYKIKEYHYSGREQSKQRTDRQFADDYIKFVGDLPITAMIVDPSAASFIAELRQRYVPVIPADNSVLDGIRLTGSLLESGKIKICDCCKETIREFGLYTWNEKIQDEDVPVKENDHHMDDTRYFCKTILDKAKQWHSA